MAFSSIENRVVGVSSRVDCVARECKPRETASTTHTLGVRSSLASVNADKEQIAEVLIRYATGIDSKDWPLLRSCWTDDVDADYGEVGHFTGADAITDVMKQLHDAMGPTYHRLGNFAIAVDGHHATARSYVHAVLQAIPDDASSWVEALGHYDDELVRTPDGWRIARRTTNIARVQAGAAHGSRGAGL
ncbi:MAG: nuclear transport factor 2 family protein [Mycobacteriaceae bacterium]|nr:nuclear transport factor 2 family protein [Mycobacteriaceae bacterium]